jgi:5-methyltetrahydrofolate--homocysteine methyltransferase
MHEAKRSSQESDGPRSPRQAISRAPLPELLAERVLVLDGAMGTMLMPAALTERTVRGARFAAHDSALAGNLDLLALTQPALVRAVHDAYLAAGADIISTNTFCSDAVSQGAYGLRALSCEISVTAARLARTCADEWTARTTAGPRFVAGVIGPSRGPLLGGTGPGETEMEAGSGEWAYRDQVRGLLDGGVDLLLVETAVTRDNARAALAAIRSELERRDCVVPVMLSMTPASVPRKVGGAAALVEDYEGVLGRPVLIVGVNCGHGSTHVAEPLTLLASSVPRFTSCHPSAGLPASPGQCPETPRALADTLASLARAGLTNVVGGCCGTTPDHIRALAEAVDGIAPRRLPARL